MDVVAVFGTDVFAFTMIDLGIVSFVGQFFIKKADNKSSKIFIISNVLTIGIMVLFSLYTGNEIFTGFEFALLGGKINVFNVTIWFSTIERLISICCSLALAACFVSVALTMIHRLKIKYADR